MNFQTLKFRLVALGLGLIAISAALRLVVALPFVQEQLRDLVAAQQLSFASYIARDVAQSIDSRKALISHLADTLPVTLLQRPLELDSWVKERELLSPLFDSGLLVIHPDGKQMFAGDPAIAGHETPDFLSTQWFQAALVANGPVMSTPQRGVSAADPIIIMAVPVHDAARRVVAVLAGVAGLDAPGFLRSLQNVQLGATGGFLLISPADKLFVGSSDESMILKPTPPPGVNLLHDRAMAGYRGTGVTINAKGVEELSAMVSVPSTSWFVVARMPTAEAFAPVNVLRDLVLKSSLAALIGILAILLFLLPRMLRPLTDAAHAIREMADSDRELELLPIVRKDEVGSLVAGFNHLVVRLREKEAALRRSEARLSFLAHHDSLTGLYNRDVLDIRLQQAVERAERTGSRFALLFCDLDGFKAINDGHGHDVGDAVLIQVAARLLEGRRRIDTVARLGGDEFVVLLADLSNARSDSEAMALQYLAAIEAPYSVGEEQFMLSVSIGIALQQYQGVSVTGAQLMSQADIAMYRAKRAGKNKVCFFEDMVTGASVAKDVAALVNVLP